MKNVLRLLLDFEAAFDDLHKEFVQAGFDSRNLIATHLFKLLDRFFSQLFKIAHDQAVQMSLLDVESNSVNDTRERFSHNF